MVVDAESHGQRLDNFLLRRLKGVPKTHVYRVIRSGEVRVNSGRAMAETRVQEGDRIRVPPVRVAQRDGSAGVGAADAAPPRAFDVLYEDDHLLAVDKPAGVAVHGGSGVSFGLIEQLRRARPQARFLELVHRLDKETSGVMLVAKKRSALTALQAQFRARGTEKRYLALVAGLWPERHKVIDLPLLRGLDAHGERFVRVHVEGDVAPRRADADDRVPRREDADDLTPRRENADDRTPRREDVDDRTPKRAVTLVNVVQHLGGCSLLEVTIKTGRTHQIRVHLAHEGMPVVGDPKYGDFALNRTYARGPLRFGRMFLHAARLGFDHPASGERLVLDSPLPAPCGALLEQLEASGASRPPAKEPSP